MRLFKMTIGLDSQAYTKTILVVSTDDNLSMDDVAKAELDARAAMLPTDPHAAYELIGPGLRLLSIDELGFYKYP